MPAAFFTPFREASSEDRSRPRDEQVRILSSGQRSSRSWVNYVSINIPYCVTKYSVGIHRAPEPHELFNRLYTSPLNIEKTVKLRDRRGFPRESRDFWHQFLPVIKSLRPSRAHPTPPHLFVYLYLSLLYLSADKCSLAEDESRLAARRFRGEEAKTPRGNVDCAVQWHVYLKYAQNAHLCTRTHAHVHIGTENDTSLA